MADNTPLAYQAEELGKEIIDAMKAWGGSDDYDARVPLAALMLALRQCLDRLPSENRKVHAREFAASLLKHVGDRH